LTTPSLIEIISAIPIKLTSSSTSNSILYSGNNPDDAVRNKSGERSSPSSLYFLTALGKSTIKASRIVSCTVIPVYLASSFFYFHSKSISCFFTSNSAGSTNCSILSSTLLVFKSCIFTLPHSTSGIRASKALYYNQKSRENDLYSLRIPVTLIFVMPFLHLS
jgi:hypothetical protein